MPRLWISTLATSLALLLAGTLLVGCGGGGSESITHIQGSSASITKPMLDHWMRVVVANDFRSVIGTKAPQGLVAEPADYGECAQAVKKVSPRTYTGKLRLSDAQIARKCRLLHQLIREQATGYLLSAQWEMLLAKEQHVSLSDAELHREFLRYRKEVYKTDASFQTYMSEHRMALSDVLYQLRRNVYVSRLLPKFQAKVNAAGGGVKTYAKLAYKRYYRLIARTTCKAGYLMESCRGYHAPVKALPSPNEVLEAIVQGARLP